MSYLELKKGVPDFNKAIISFWFIAPKEALEKMKEKQDAENEAQGDNPHPVHSRLTGVLPLITFGPLLEGYQLDHLSSAESGSYNKISWHTPGESWVVSFVEPHTYSPSSFYVKVAPYHVNPSYIGLIYNSNDEKYQLHVYLQSGSLEPVMGVIGTRSDFLGDVNTGAATGAALDTFLETHWEFNTDMYEDHDVAPDNPRVSIHSTVEASDEWIQQFGPDSFEFGYGITVEPDKWHHVLISFDLSKSTVAKGLVAEGLQGDYSGSRGTTTITAERSVSNPCLAWIAFDDKNIAKKGINDGAEYLPANGIMSRYNKAAYQAQGGGLKSRAWGITGVVEDATSIGLPQSLATYPGAKLPAAPLGIPAASALVDNVYNVEMAELQMWTGRTLDTSDEKKRRLFVDKNGKPVGPYKAEKVLDRPAVLLHGTSNWIHGKNTGTLGMQVDKAGAQTLIKEGQFKPTGEIDPYRPDPKLEEAIPPPPTPTAPPAPTPTSVSVSVTEGSR